MNIIHEKIGGKLPKYSCSNCTNYYKCSSVSNVTTVLSIIVGMIMKSMRNK